MSASFDERNSSFIDPLFNEAFIRIFGLERSKGLTRALVNAVLGAAGLPKISAIEKISAEHAIPNGCIECKTPRLDVHIVAERTIVDLEAQLYKTSIADRGAFYAADALSEGTGKIRNYNDLPCSVAITLLDGPLLFKDIDEWIHVAKLYWDGGVNGLASDRIALVVVELSKFRKRYNCLSEEVLSNEMYAWAYLLTQGYSKTQEVSDIVDTFPSLEEFAELYGLAANDPEVKRMHRDAWTAELEYNRRLEYIDSLKREGLEEGRQKVFEQGREQGLEQGLARGREQGLEQGIRNMEAFSNKLRESGVDESLIAKASAAVLAESKTS